MKPLVVPVEEFCRLAGNLGKTSAYALLKAGDVDRVKIGRRTFVTMASIERFVERSTEKAAR